MRKHGSLQDRPLLFPMETPLQRQTGSFLWKYRVEGVEGRELGLEV